MEEKPTIEEPTVEPEKEVEAPKIDVDALVKELEKAGVSTAQELQNKLTASREAGQLANLLGDANKRIADLEQAVRQPPAAEQEFDYSEGHDIETIIEKKLTSVLDAREAEARQAQQQAMEIWQGIQTDPDYGLVKDVWEAKIKDPNFNIAVSAGKKDVAKEYMETVRKYYKGIAKKSLDTITTLQKGGVPTTPHVEGEAQLPGVPEVPNEGNETINKAKEKVAKGGLLSEDEEMAALEAILSG